MVCRCFAGRFLWRRPETGLVVTAQAGYPLPAPPPTLLVREVYRQVFYFKLRHYRIN